MVKYDLQNALFCNFPPRLLLQKVSVCALLMAVAARAESDPNADADSYYSPYRTYNTHAGYPYR